MHRRIYLHVCTCTDMGYSHEVCETYDYVLVILTQSKPFYDLVLCFISHEGHTLVGVKGRQWVYKYHSAEL